MKLLRNSYFDSTYAVTKLWQEIGSLKAKLEDHTMQVQSYELAAKASADNLLKVTSAVRVWSFVLSIQFIFI